MKLLSSRIRDGCSALVGNRQPQAQAGATVPARRTSKPQVPASSIASLVLPLRQDVHEVPSNAMDSTAGFRGTEVQGRLRQALGDCEEKFLLLASGIADYALIMLDVRGNVSGWNVGAERLLGYSASDIVGRHTTVFYTEEDRALGVPAQELTKARATGRFETNGWRLRRDGSRFTAHIVITALQDAGGALRGYAETIRDSSSRTRLEERFRRVVEAAPSAMVMVDADGRIEMVNIQAERVFGYSRSELLGQPVEMLVPERFGAHHPRLRTGFMSAPLSRPMGAGRDLYARRKDGSEFPVEIGLNPMETEEGPMVLSAIVDISDRKEKEDHIKAALREKDVLLGEIHHRVKNNLQIVHSLLDLQSTRIEDPTVLGMLQDTRNRIQSMALIHQTLYQSQDFSGVDFGHFLENLAPILAVSYGTERARVNLSIDTGKVLVPLNAAIPCGLIVNELVTNSLKHAFPAGNRGEILISLATEGRETVRVSVRDDGVGIPEELELAKSTSLGLKLVVILTEQLGGELDVQRARPTEFTLRFPLSD